MVIFFFSEPINELLNYKIVQIACGATHSLAITEWGQLYVWGSNSRGQLARQLIDNFSAKPMLVKSLATKHIVQIASGLYHSLALTNSNILNDKPKKDIIYTNHRYFTFFLIFFSIFSVCVYINSLMSFY